MSDSERFTVTMDLREGYRFLVDFEHEGVPPLLVDEPEPSGVAVDVAVEPVALDRAA